MKEFKGTKGEWKADKGNTYNGVPDKEFEIGTDNQIIATIHGSHYAHTAVDKTEAKANAKLITAAPELLQACIDVCNSDSQFKLYEARKACVLAIQKALK